MNTKYNPVKHLSSALLRSNPKTDTMAFITGYFDESYSHSPKPLVYTVAGYVSTDEKWFEFQEKWQAVLDRENLPYFSGKNASNLCKNWTDEKKISVTIELQTILKEAYQGGFSASVIVDDYNALSDKCKFFLGKPHLLAMTKCFKLIEEWCNEINFHHPIHYVFEHGAKDNKFLGLHYSELLTAEIRDRYRIESFSFFTKKCTPLQVADMLAYETRKDIMRRFPTENHRKMRKSLESLIDWTRNRWAVLDKHYFDWVMNQPLFQTIPDNDEHNARIADAKKRGII